MKGKRLMGYAWDRKGRKPHPVIRIGGRFLESLGFQIGDPVAVEYEVGEIVIRSLQVREECEEFQALSKIRNRADIDEQV